MVESVRLNLSREAPELKLAEAGDQPEGSLVEQLDQRIKEHESHNSEKGLISRGVGAAFRVVEKITTGQNSDVASLEELKRLRQEAARVKDNPAALTDLKIEEAIKKDVQSFHWQDEVSHYGAGFIKAVPLFMTRGKGMYLSAALHGADQVRTSTSVPLMAADFTLGATKGALLKAGLDKFGASQAPIWQKGLALGGGMSFVENALTSSTWYDHRSGNWHVGEGALQTAGGTLLGAGSGAVVFPLGHKIFEGIGASKFGADALRKSPLLSNLANGWSFGLASGTTGETIRQIQSGEGIDPLKIATRGAIQSMVDMGAAGAGYKMSFVGRTGESGRTNFEWSKKEGADQPSQVAREFKVVGGEKALNDALAKVDGEGAMVKVRERLGAGTGWRRLLGMQTYGEATDMFIQHRPEGRALNADAVRARFIAACDLDAALAGQAVVPGKDVFMQIGKDRVRFTPEAPKEGQFVKLGETHAEAVQRRNAGQVKGLERIPADARIKHEEIFSEGTDGPVKFQLLEDTTGTTWSRWEWTRPDNSTVKIESVRKENEERLLYEHGDTQVVFDGNRTWSYPRFVESNDLGGVKIHVRATDGQDLRTLQAELIQALAHDPVLVSRISQWKTQNVREALTDGKDANGFWNGFGEGERAKGFTIYLRSDAHLIPVVERLEAIIGKAGLSLERAMEAEHPTFTQIEGTNRITVTRDLLERSPDSTKDKPIAKLDAELVGQIHGKYNLAAGGRLSEAQLREVETASGLKSETLAYDSQGNLVLKTVHASSSDSYGNGIYLTDTGIVNQDFGGFTDRRALYALSRDFGLNPALTSPRYSEGKAPELQRRDVASGKPEFAVRNAQHVEGLERIPVDAQVVGEWTKDVESGKMHVELLKDTRDGAERHWLRQEWTRQDGSKVTVETVRDSEGNPHHLFQTGDTQMVMTRKDGFHSPRLKSGEAPSTVQVDVQIKDGADLREVQIKLIEALAHDPVLRSNIADWKTPDLFASLSDGQFSGKTEGFGAGDKAKGLTIHLKDGAELPAVLEKLDGILADAGLALPHLDGTTASHGGRSNRLTVSERAASPADAPVEPDRIILDFAAGERPSITFKVEGLPEAEATAYAQMLDRGIEHAFDVAAGTRGSQARFRQFAEQQDPQVARTLESLVARYPQLVEAVHDAFNVLDVRTNSELQGLGRLRTLLESRVASQTAYRLVDKNQQYRSGEEALITALRQEIQQIREEGGDVDHFLTNVRRFAMQKGEQNVDDLVSVLREASLPPQGITLQGEEPNLQIEIKPLENELQTDFDARVNRLAENWQEFMQIINPDRLPQDTQSYLEFRSELFNWLNRNSELWNVAIAFGRLTRDSQVAGPLEYYFYHYQPDAPIRLLDRFPGVPPSEGTWNKFEAAEHEAPRDTRFEPEDRQVERQVEQGSHSEQVEPQQRLSDFDTEVARPTGT